MENLSKNKKISLGLGVVLIISLFLPWFKFVIFSVTLIGIPGTVADLTTGFGSMMGEIPDIPFKVQLAMYMGYAFLILGSAGLYFNYKGAIQKSKLAYYSMIGYFVLVLLLNISDLLEAFDGMGELDDGPSIFSLLGIGIYVFIASYIGNLKYLKEETEPEMIDDPEVNN